MDGLVHLFLLGTSSVTDVFSLEASCAPDFFVLVELVANFRMAVHSPFPLIARKLIYPSIQNGFRILPNWSSCARLALKFFLPFSQQAAEPFYLHASYMPELFLPHLSIVPEGLAVSRSLATRRQFVSVVGIVGPCVSSK